MITFRFFLPPAITWGKTGNIELKIQLYTQVTLLEIFKVVNIFIMALHFTSPSNVNCYDRQKRVYHLHFHLYPEDQCSVSLETLMPTYQ
jgi:hypothetical protein